MKDEPLDTTLMLLNRSQPLPFINWAWCWLFATTLWWWPNILIDRLPMGPTLFTLLLPIILMLTIVFGTLQLTRAFQYVEPKTQRWAWVFLAGLVYVCYLLVKFVDHGHYWPLMVLWACLLLLVAQEQEHHGRAAPLWQGMRLLLGTYVIQWGLIEGLSWGAHHAYVIYLVVGVPLLIGGVRLYQRARFWWATSWLERALTFFLLGGLLFLCLSAHWRAYTVLIDKEPWYRMEGASPWSVRGEGWETLQLIGWGMYTVGVLFAGLAQVYKKRPFQPYSSFTP